MSQQPVSIDKNVMCSTLFPSTCVPVKNLFGYLETGEMLEAFLDDLPSVRRE